LNQNNSQKFSVSLNTHVYSNDHSHLACYKTISSTFSHHLTYKIYTIDKIQRSSIGYNDAWIRKKWFFSNSKTPLTLKEQPHVNNSWYYKYALQYSFLEFSCTSHNPFPTHKTCLFSFSFHGVGFLQSLPYLIQSNTLLGCLYPTPKWFDLILLC